MSEQWHSSHYSELARPLLPVAPRPPDRAVCWHSGPAALARFRLQQIQPAHSACLHSGWVVPVSGAWSRRSFRRLSFRRPNLAAPDMSRGHMPRPSAGGGDAWKACTSGFLLPWSPLGRGQRRRGRVQPLFLPRSPRRCPSRFMAGHNPLCLTWEPDPSYWDFNRHWQRNSAPPRRCSKRTKRPRSWRSCWPRPTRYATALRHGPTGTASDNGSTPRPAIRLDLTDSAPTQRRMGNHV